jgi:hypothetical protein
MKIQPDRSYKTPNYPTNDIVKQEPAWLRSNIPASWKGKKRIAQMLSVLLFGGTVMPNDFVIGDPKLPKEVIARLDSLKIKAVKEDKQAAVLVAPIFEHGEGRGATGCIVIAPPVFLSEEDARQIIETELKKANIVFDTTNIKLNDLVYEKDNNKFVPMKARDHEDSIQTRSFVLERYDKDANFGYVYITSHNYFQYGGIGDFGTLRNYNTKAVAQEISQALQKYGKVNAAVFYNPLPPSNYGFKLRSSDGKEINDNGIDSARYLLRAQVQDFVAWLKYSNISNNAK